LKYHRITGGDGAKEFYNREWAAEAAIAHADHFLQSRRQQLTELDALMANPIIVVPFDAELFGHWWYEGPLFLERFIRQVAAHSDEFQLTTPSDYLAQHPTQEIIAPAASSWGEKGYWGVWLDESNSWIYPHLHASARRMTEVARQNADAPTALVERVLKQLARELLLMQSSDWAFLIKMGTAKHYAAKRTVDHVTRFNILHEQLKTAQVDEAFLSDCETRDNLFPDVDWRYYLDARKAK
jgi:1,4-alpha-glucan branching enzyme